MKCLFRQKRTIRTFILLALIWIPLLGVALAADLEIDDQTGAIGDQIHFAVWIPNAPNDVSSLGVDIGFDYEIIEYVSTDFSGTLLDGWSFTDVSNPANGLLRLGAFTIEGQIAAGSEGGLAKIAFRVIGTDGCQLNLQSLKDGIEGWATKDGSFNYTSTLNVTTTEITSIISESAMSGGNVTSDENDSVSARGVCWRESVNPTIADAHTDDGENIGVFTSFISGLSPGTTYHVRAYATNSSGTTYGNNRTFTTSAEQISPVPDIKANGSDGPLTISSTTPVSITVTLAAGNQAGQEADWWVVAFAPSGLYSYVYPTGWEEEINFCVQAPLVTSSTPYEVLRVNLPIGQYQFAFAVDENMDGIPDATWWDFVDVNVQE